MQVKVLIFGQLTDITGMSELNVKDVSNRDDLISLLHQRYPALTDAKYVIAIDKKITSQNASLNENSIIALLPPFSGG